VGQVVVVEHQELMVQWFVRSKWIKRCRNIRKFRKYELVVWQAVHQEVQVWNIRKFRKYRS
jgi:hypothetical protein